MGTAFATKSARIFIAEDTSRCGTRLCDTLRKHGFLEITVVNSARDIFEALQHGDCDWIIISGFLNQAVNAYHILKTIADHPSLRSVRTSLLVDKDDEKYLRTAFELGAMSWHSMASVEADPNAEIDKLLELMKVHNWTMPLIASEYFRKHMLAIEDFESLLTLEKSLLELFPGSLPLLMRFAENQLRFGLFNEGLATLHQACVIDERAIKAADAIIEVHAPNQSRTGFEAPKAIENNILGIKSCVIIDPDLEVISALRELLLLSGVPEIHSFDDGLKAWEWLSTHSEPDLILQEWRITGLSGPLLLQRIRHHGFTKVPVNVISSVIKPEESHLLREFSVANVIAKPFDSQGLFKSLVWTVQQHVFPTEQNSLQQKLRRLLQDNQVSEAERIKDAFLADPRNKTSGKKTIEANFAFGCGDYRLARDAGLEALKLQGDTLCLLNLIGKSLLKLGDPQSAAKAFQKAQSMSPINIENLCLMALAFRDSDAPTEAEATLKKAKLLDSGSAIVAETECFLALINGEVTKAKDLLEEWSTAKVLVGAMKERSLAFSRLGHYEDAFLTLRQLDEVLPPRLMEAKDEVAMCLAQSLARHGDWEQAKATLSGIVNRKDALIHPRAVKLLARIERAIVENVSIPYYESLDEADQDMSPNPFASQSKEYYRGELCLKGILSASHEERLTSSQLFAHQPIFLDKSDRRARSVQKDL